jgi:hypothetical protein
VVFVCAGVHAPAGVPHLEAATQGTLGFTTGGTAGFQPGFCSRPLVNGEKAYFVA